MAKISDEIREFVRRSYADEHMDPRELLAIADRVDRETVELPKDADGVPIRVGDVVEWCDSGDTLTVEGIGKDIVFYIDNGGAEWTAARNKRHHKPTVEDVLREMADRCYADEDEPRDRDAIVAEYAAKLRLAEGEDA